MLYIIKSFSFFFNDTATTEIYTLSLHDALPISGRLVRASDFGGQDSRSGFRSDAPPGARSAAAATGRGGRVAAMPGKRTRFQQIFLTHLRQVKGRLAIAAAGTLEIGRASCRERV